MTLDIVRTMECDACGKRQRLGEMDHGWMRVYPVVGSEEDHMEVMRLAEEGKEPLDTGDVCSLTCLISWASSRRSLRELDAEARELGFE